MFRRDDLADDLLHADADELGLFNARTDRRPERDGELALIDGREEVCAEPRCEEERGDEGEEDPDEELRLRVLHALECLGIATIQRLEQKLHPPEELV